MANTKTQKARAEVEKARKKLMEQQTKLKELEARQTEFENLDIVDIVRGMSIPLDNLADILKYFKSGVISGVPTSGQPVPKSAGAEPILTQNGQTEKENESE
jgi:hypothetical protein